MYLLDVNLLIALTWPNHVFHGLAHTWFDGVVGPWATCAITETAFVRLSMNAAVVSEPLSWPAALELLRRTRAAIGHRYLSEGDGFDIAASAVATEAPVVGHHQVTDIYLAAFAHHHGARLATLDSGIAQAVHPRHRDLVELVRP